MNVQSVSNGRTVQIAGLTLEFQSFGTDGDTVSGKQLAAKILNDPDERATVLELLVSGELESIRPDEEIDLTSSTGKFLVAESDRSYKFTLNDVLLEWPCRLISGGQLRKLGQIVADDDIYQIKSKGEDQLLSSHDLVDLGESGIEVIHSRKRVWKLNVQGVLLEVHQPTISARTAIAEAGFDSSKEWIIVLRVQGKPKQVIGIDDVIDLRTPGIEKLRLTPKGINNGDNQKNEPRRMFNVLDVDEKFLNGAGLFWETVIDSGRRWLLIHHYSVPAGYTENTTLLALEIPPMYPGAQIDMFFTSPALGLKSGRAIDRTQPTATIMGQGFYGWSRHRGPEQPWDPARDNVATHLALVESAINREVGE